MIEKTTIQSLRQKGEPSMGSVKDIEIAKKPTAEKMGIGRFVFSDRYSVFDWGEMPDLVDGKGAALCMMGAYCFEKLETGNIRTHYRGIVDRDGETRRFNELTQPSNTMEVNLLNVCRPQAHIQKGKLRYDYSLYTPNLRNCLIPLEMIYRNALPQGSSVFKRLEQKEITLQDLGMDHYPEPGEHLSQPILEVSTKLENKDRYVTWTKAKKIAGLTDDEVGQIKALLLKIDELITRLIARAGLKNEDGKVELGFDPDRRLMAVDVVGTLDECRFTYDGLHVSKEIAREFYRKTEWYKDVEEAKKSADAQGIKDWRTLCRSKPPRLDSKLKATIGAMYMAAANDVTDRRLFDVPRLGEVVEEYRKYEGERK